MNVALIGGGVIGGALALELAQKGAHVTVLERASPGAEASGAAAGILGAQAEAKTAGPLLELCLASRALYPGFVAHLEELSGMDVGFRARGVLHVTTRASGASELRQVLAWQREQGLRAEWLSGPEARELEPALAPEVLGAAYFPDDGQVDNRLLVEALARATRLQGVTWRQAEAVAVEERAGRVTGVLMKEGRLDAEAVVLAAGAWTQRFSAAGLPPDVLQPRRGQMVQVRSPSPPLSRVIFGDAGYLVPRADGRMLLGSTMERAGFDKRVTVQGLSLILHRALEVYPALAHAEVTSHWAGLRPECLDGLPLLGKGPLEGLFIASGHFRNGILLAPITGETMSDVVLGRTPRMDLGPFGLSRGTLRADSGIAGVPR